MIEPSERRVALDGVELVLFEWGERAGETVLLVHATGFHARCWDQVVARLDGYHVIAVDQRGHGRSEKSGPYTWDRFGQDMAQLVVALQLDDIVGVGHSMGGHVITQAAARHQERFRRLLLVDPVILAPEVYRNVAAARPTDGVHPVARRRNHFTIPDEMYLHMEQRGSYALWDPKVLRDYCEYGLLPDEDQGGYRLACPPEVEAAIYAGSSGCDVHPDVAQITLPVTVLRARERGIDTVQSDFSNSPTWPGLAGRFAHGEDVPLPHLTHFIPMQDPDLVAARIRA